MDYSLSDDYKELDAEAIEQMSIKYRQLQNCLLLTEMECEENSEKFLKTLAELEQKNTALDELNKTLEDKLESKVQDLVDINWELKSEIELRMKAEFELERKNQILESKISAKDFELRYAKDFARKARTVKNEFLANISHELMTPIHWILNYSDFGMKLLEDGSSDEKLRHFFSEITGGGKALLGILNNVITYSSLIKNEVVPNKEMTEIGKLIHEVLQLYIHSFSEKNIDVEYECKDECYINCDVVLIRHVLYNLMSNALEHSPRDSEVIILCKAIDSSVSITIEDQGHGIPVNEREEVFLPFNEHSAFSNGAGGRGLGLAMCKHIVTTHNGRIWIETGGKGVGVKLCVKLPGK